MRRTEGTPEAVRAVTEADTGIVNRQRRPKPPLIAVGGGSLEEEISDLHPSTCRREERRDIPNRGDSVMKGVCGNSRFQRQKSEAV